MCVLALTETIVLESSLLIIQILDLILIYY